MTRDEIIQREDELNEEEIQEKEPSEIEYQEYEYEAPQRVSPVGAESFSGSLGGGGFGLLPLIGGGLAGGMEMEADPAFETESEYAYAPQAETERAEATNPMREAERETVLRPQEEKNPSTEGNLVPEADPEPVYRNTLAAEKDFGREGAEVHVPKKELVDSAYGEKSRVLDLEMEPAGEVHIPKKDLVDSAYGEKARSLETQRVSSMNRGEAAQPDIRDSMEPEGINLYRSESTDSSLQSADYRPQSEGINEGTGYLKEAQKTANQQQKEKVEEKPWFQNMFQAMGEYQAEKNERFARDPVGTMAGEAASYGMAGAAIAAAPAASAMMGTIAANALPAMGSAEGWNSINKSYSAPEEKINYKAPYSINPLADNYEYAASNIQKTTPSYSYKSTASPVNYENPVTVNYTNSQTNKIGGVASVVQKPSSNSVLKSNLKNANKLQTK